MYSKDCNHNRENKGNLGYIDLASEHYTHVPKCHILYPKHMYNYYQQKKFIDKHGTEGSATAWMPNCHTGVPGLNHGSSASDITSC